MAVRNKELEIYIATKIVLKLSLNCIKGVGDNKKENKNYSTVPFR